MNLFENNLHDIIDLGFNATHYFYIVTTIIAVIFLSLCFVHKLLSSFLNTKILFYLLDNLSYLFVCDRDGNILKSDASKFLKLLKVNKINTLHDLHLSPENLDLLLNDIRTSFDLSKKIKRDFRDIRLHFTISSFQSPFSTRQKILCAVFDISHQIESYSSLESEISDYKTALNISKNAVLILDNDRNVLYFNEYAESITKYRSRDVLGLNYKSILSIYKKSDNLSAISEIDSAFTNGIIMQYREDLYLVPRTSSRIAIGITACPLYNIDGTQKGVLITFTDLSALNDARENAERSCQIVSKLCELTDCGFFYYSTQERKLYNSNNFMRYWPLGNGKYLSEEEWIHPDDVQEFLKLRNEISRGEINSIDTTFRSDYSGSLRYYNVKAISCDFTEKSINFNLFAIIKDVTSQKNQSFVNDKNNAFVNTLFKFIPTPFYTKEISDDYKYCMCSQSWCDIIGIESQNIIGKTDFDIFEDSIANMLLNDDKSANKVKDLYTSKLRIFSHKYNSYRYYHIEKFVYNTIDGKRMLMATFIDLTDSEQSTQHQIELRLFYEKIIDNLPVCVSVKSVEEGNKYILWNKTSAVTFGESKEYVIGKTDSEIPCLRRYASNINKTDTELISNEKSLISFEHRLSIDKKSRDFNISKFLLKNGEKSYIVRIANDITNEQRLTLESKNHIELLKNNVVFGSMINSTLKRVIVENNFSKSIDDMLAALGIVLNCDRTYTFIYTDDHKSFTCDHEWVREGVSSQLNNLVDLKTKEFSNFQKHLDAIGYVSMDDVEAYSGDLEECIPILKMQEIKSFMLVSIVSDSKIIALVGIDFVGKKHLFTSDDIRMLRAIESIYLIARQRSEQFDAIIESAAMQKLIIDSMHMPILLIDNNYKLLHANKALCGGIGISNDDCVGKNCYNIFCKRKYPDETCIANMAMRSGHLESKEIHIYGRELLANALPIKVNGKITQVLETYIDITESNKAKAVLRDAAKSAREAEKSKSMFIATMSHELRTPLNAVIGFAELLKNGEVYDEQQKDSIDSIYLASNTLLALINDILDLSKLEAGEMKIIPAYVNFQKLLSEIDIIFKHRLLEKHLKCTISISSSFPILYIDALRIRQILMNIIGNSIKFTKVGGITISVGFSQKIDNKGDLNIIIRDTGIGISNDYLKKIFEPFVQQDNLGEHRVGTGLGLSICKRLIDKMGGELTVKSVLGKGSSFSIKIPDILYSFDSKLIKNNEDNSNTTSTFNMKAIIVDDVPLNIKVLSTMLRKFGIESIASSSAEEAWSELNSFVPDIVFTDMWMDKMTGIDFARKIRSSDRFKNTKIILASADTTHDNMDISIFDGTIHKPITISKLYDLLRFIKNNKFE